MAVANTAIINIAKAIPNINRVLLSLAMAVIAITLSKDIETSAIIIVVKAAFIPLPDKSTLEVSSSFFFRREFFNIFIKFPAYPK